MKQQGFRRSNDGMDRYDEPWWYQYAPIVLHAQSMEVCHHSCFGQVFI